MDRRAVLAALLGASAIACVATPFAVVGQRNAPKPAAPAPVTHTTPPPVVAVETPAPPPPPDEKPVAHTFRVRDLATDAHVSIVDGTVGKHVFLTALTAAGLAPKEAHRVYVGFLGVKNMDRLDPDDAFTFAKAADGHVVAFELMPVGASQGASLDFFQEREDGPHDKLVAKRVSLPIDKRTLKVGLVIGDDLRSSLASAGLKEDAATMLDDALDGHAELADLHAGARVRIVATEERIEGAFAGYAPLDAVEFDFAGKPPVRVYWYTPKRAKGGYFDAQGRQPYHGAWRSPVPMARISSRFDPHRMHPVLHVVMPHNGVDFAAPAGTPVYAAAAGVIRSAGDSGPCGNMVQIDHPNGLTSAYCHLSRFGPIHPGEHVETRQLIGYVGQTGRATGPHLHFAVKRWNKAGQEIFIDPLSMKLDGVRVVPPKQRGEFDQARAALDTELDAIPLPQAPTEEPKAVSQETE